MTKLSRLFSPVTEVQLTVLTGSIKSPEERKAVQNRLDNAELDLNLVLRVLTGDLTRHYCSRQDLKSLLELMVSVTESPPSSALAPGNALRWILVDALVVAMKQGDIMEEVVLPTFLKSPQTFSDVINWHDHRGRMFRIWCPQLSEANMLYHFDKL